MDAPAVDRGDDVSTASCPEAASVHAPVRDRAGPPGRSVERFDVLASVTTNLKRLSDLRRLPERVSCRRRRTSPRSCVGVVLARIHLAGINIWLTEHGLLLATVALCMARPTRPTLHRLTSERGTGGSSTASAPGVSGLLSVGAGTPEDRLHRLRQDHQVEGQRPVLDVTHVDANRVVP